MCNISNTIVQAIERDKGKGKKGKKGKKKKAKKVSSCSDRACEH